MPGGGSGHPEEEERSGISARAAAAAATGLGSASLHLQEQQQPSRGLRVFQGNNPSSVCLSACSALSLSFPAVSPLAGKKLGIYSQSPRECRTQGGEKIFIASSLLLLLLRLLYK